jgi:D-aminopeptidase
MEVDVRAPTMATAASWCPECKRSAGTTVHYRAPDIATGYDIVELVALLGGTLWQLCAFGMARETGRYPGRKM